MAGVIVFLGLFSVLVLILYWLAFNRIKALTIENGRLKSAVKRYEPLLHEKVIERAPKPEPEPEPEPAPEPEFDRLIETLQNAGYSVVYGRPPAIAEIDFPITEELPAPELAENIPAPEPETPGEETAPEPPPNVSQKKKRTSKSKKRGNGKE